MVVVAVVIVTLPLDSRGRSECCSGEVLSGTSWCDFNDMVRLCMRELGSVDADAASFVDGVVILLMLVVVADDVSMAV